MKKSMLCMLMVVLTSTIAVSQEKLQINPKTSELKWSCDMEFYFGGHHGEVDFKEGYFIKTGKKISGGAFVIDMNRMSDESGEYENGLISHLKDPDFFDVKLYPTSKLVFTNVIYYDSTHMRINANLTIKDITLPIFFNAEVDFNKKQLTTRFKIDRTLWGITYNNKVKNDAISDAIAFQVTLKL